MDIKKWWKSLPKRYVIIVLVSLIAIVIVLLTVFKKPKQNENQPKDSAAVAKETNLVIPDNPIDTTSPDVREKANRFKQRIAKERIDRAGGKKDK